MKLSDYCTIDKNGTVWIDIDSGWKFRCNLNGMTPDYAQLFIHRLSKKRRLDDEEELLDAEVIVPDMAAQESIVGAVKSVDKLWMKVGTMTTAYNELQQMTADAYYDEMRRYYSNLLGELNDHRFLLIDQLMGV